MPPNIRDTAPVVLTKSVVDKSANPKNILNVSGAPVTPESTGTSFLELQQAFGLVGPKLIASWREDQDKRIAAETANYNYETLREKLSKQEREWAKKGVYPTGGGTYRRFRELELLGDKYIEQQGRQLETDTPKFTVRDAGDPEEHAQNLFTLSAPSSPIARRRAALLWPDIKAHWLRKVDAEKSKQDLKRTTLDTADTFYDIFKDLSGSEDLPDITVGKHLSTSDAARAWGAKNASQAFERDKKTGKRLKAGEEYTDGKGKKKIWTEDRTLEEDDYVRQVFYTLQRLKRTQDSHHAVTGSSGIDLLRQTYYSFYRTELKRIQSLAGTNKSGAEDELQQLQHMKTLMDSAFKGPWSSDSQGMESYAIQQSELETLFNSTGSLIENQKAEPLQDHKKRVHALIDAAVRECRDAGKPVTKANVLGFLDLSDKDWDFIAGNNLLSPRIENHNKEPVILPPEVMQVIAAIARQSQLSTDEKASRIRGELNKYYHSETPLSEGQVPAGLTPESRAPIVSTDSVEKDLTPMENHPKTAHALLTLGPILKQQEPFDEHFTRFLTENNHLQNLHSIQWERDFSDQYPGVVAAWTEETGGFRFLERTVPREMIKRLRTYYEEAFKASYDVNGEFNPEKAKESIGKITAEYLDERQEIFAVSEIDNGILYDNKLMAKWLPQSEINKLSDFQSKIASRLADVPTRKEMKADILPEAPLFTFQPIGVEGTNLGRMPISTFVRQDLLLTPAIPPIQAAITGVQEAQTPSQRRKTGRQLEKVSRTIYGQYIGESPVDDSPQYGIKIRKETEPKEPPRIIAMGWREEGDNTYMDELLRMGHTGPPGWVLVHEGGVVTITDPGVLKRLDKGSSRSYTGDPPRNINDHGVTLTPNEESRILSSPDAQVQTESLKRAIRLGGLQQDHKVYIDGTTSNGFSVIRDDTNFDPLKHAFASSEQIHDAFMALGKNEDIRLTNSSEDYETLINTKGFTVDLSMVDTTGEITGGNALVVAYERYQRLYYLKYQQRGMGFQNFVYRTMTGVQSRFKPEPDAVSRVWESLYTKPIKEDKVTTSTRTRGSRGQRN